MKWSDPELSEKIMDYNQSNPSFLNAKEIIYNIINKLIKVTMFQEAKKLEPCHITKLIH